MNKRDIFWLLSVVLLWRVVLFAVVMLGSAFLPNSVDFLGGGVENYLKNPQFWAWANFDGEHYLSIAQNGYRPLLYFYFPLYPLLVELFSFSDNIFSLQLSAIVVSHLAFVVALIGMWKLLALDYIKPKIRVIILAMLAFPTSFYLVASYTESLFLACVVWSFYFTRKKRYLLSGLVGGLSSATRIVGISLLVSQIVEIFTSEKKHKFRNLIFSLTTLSGFLAYIIFLILTTGNPFEFNAGSELFGEYRAQEPLLLPRIFYRYIFKILPNLNYLYLPSTFTSLLELATGIMLTLLAIIGFFRVRVSYFLYMLAGFIMPSMYNGFVSLPRYAVVLFPIFIIIGNFIYKRRKLGVIYCLVSVVLLTVATILFTRGYWVS